MSNSIDPDAVKAATMADLSRFRQEELPLSHQARRPDRPTYAPSGNNGTNHYSDTTKAVLENKWAAKINDGESQSMEGLELEDSRPWAKGQTRKRLPNITVDRVAPAIPASRGTFSSYQSRGTRVQFKPTTPATWGPPPTETATRTNRQQPPPNATHNGSSTTANAASVNGTSCTPLVAKMKNEDDRDLIASERLVYRKQCHLVPGKAEALSIVTNVAIKIRDADNDGILEIQNDSKGVRIHNALELEQPVIDGVFCTIKVKTRPFSEKLRFATVGDAQGFKINLFKLQNALLDQQKEQDIGESQVADNTEESNKAEEDGDLLMTSSPIASTASDTSIPVLNGPSQQAPTADQEPLIMADDDWGTAANNNIPSVWHETIQLSQLLRQVLEQFAALGNHSGETMNGIEYEILEQALSHGFLHECDEKVREDILAIIRSMFNVGCKLVSREFASGLGDTMAIETPVNGDAKGLGGATAEQAEDSKQVEDSTNRSVVGMPKGLGASRFAKKPAAYHGNFTGPIKY
ncbi:hypothetical protein IWW34DRAFT_829113 [Fusarium oxysporum f. sp. albedinis]|nr:hypothetical protein IWW34DRAFT_829113 [Fusarium oxysporum f. sp. albedinis]KAJ0133482.1 hypothetical protein HZ326_23456 [Fusarium oxysporum f. sp. albedinis]KAK2479156.1 hypothetical protein H9L39_08530 [Fusarium oxysporum f. sp. albedinis]